MQLTKEELLEEAIERKDYKSFITLLQEGINLSTQYDEDGIYFNLLHIAVDKAFEIKSLDYVKALLDYGADINDQHPNTVLVIVAMNSYIEMTQLLLDYGADVNLIDEENATVLFESMSNNLLEEARLFINYGAYATINKKNLGIPCFCTILGSCAKNLLKIKFLLDNGADTSIRDIDGLLAVEIMERYKGEMSIEDYQTLKTLLNPNNPPYLKLGESEEDKYIIYENKKTDDKNYEIYLLTNKQKQKDKKYLYTDNKSDAFVYWCYKNELLVETLMDVIGSHVETIEVLDVHSIDKLLISTVGEKLTTDYFTEEGKEFATAYLTVTHWWYNLHTDFNRLYQDDSIRLPRAIKSQEEFDTLMKLLDIRHTQFQSGKEFNSNQNKEELEALIEGREPPKRVVDLSFLEETKKQKEPLPHIHLSSNQTVPKTGRYQATLPKGHEQEELITHSGFDIKHLKEGESVGTFGLSGSDEYDIVWVYLGE